uniref:Uncharacterized protein n=1 Tax=Equus asinus TaxID=9793 RepID=A0A8C4KRL9_EQUAS
MTQGAVHASPPVAQRVLRRVPGEWAIRNIGQKLKESNCRNWRTTDWPEIQKDFEASQSVCPFGRTPIPLSVTFCLAWDGYSGGIRRRSSVPPVSSSVRVINHPDPGPHLTS